MISTALQQAQKASYDETVRAFRTHNSEKAVVFRGRLARSMQQPWIKLTDFLGDLQYLAVKVYLEESNAIPYHLVVRGFLKGIHNSQFGLDSRKSLVDADLKIESVVEKALHLEAVTRIQEAEREPKVAVLQPDNTERLVNCVNNLVECLSLSWDSRSDNRGSFRKRNNCRSS